MPKMHEVDYKIFGDDMQFVEIELDPKEAVVAEAGSMMYMQDGIEMDTIFGEGSQLRDFNYVEDVVAALLAAAASEAANGQVYNLGSGVPVSVLESARAVIAAAGSGTLEQVEFPADKRRIEVGDYYADFGKIQAALGWRPRIGFEEGLRRTVDYYQRWWPHYWGAPA